MAAALSQQPSPLSRARVKWDGVVDVPKLGVVVRSRLLFSIFVFGYCSPLAVSVSGAEPLESSAGLSWSGVYTGVSAGYLVGEADYTFSNTAPSGSSDASGLAGGFFAGYNWQTGPLVLGIEGDVDVANVDGTFSKSADLTSVGETSVNWQGSLRGRLGLALDHHLVFLTAGWAIADADFRGGPVPAPACCGYSETVEGWTVGGGTDYAVSQNVTLRLEYRFTDFDEASGDLAPGFSDVQMPVDLSTHAIRAGVAWNW